MAARLRAVYRQGVFVPQAPCDLPENATVDLIVEGSTILPPEEPDPAVSQQLLEELVAEMQRHPWPVEAPRPRQEELHASR